MNEILLSSAVQPIVCICDCIIADKSFCYPDCVHDYNVLIYVVAGTVYVTEDEVGYEVNEGELIFLKHNIRQRGIREIRCGTKWYYIHFYLDDPGDDALAFEPNSAPLVLNQSLRYYEVLPKKLCGLKNGPIENKIIDLVEYCRVGDDLKRMRINCMLYSLLADIALAKYIDKYDYSLSYRIRGWLEKHYAEPFSTEKLEKEFFIGYKRMAAVFKQEYGITMQQYHNKQRMQVAAHLLKTTLLPIGDVANKLGFEDRLYFSRCFREFSGISPKEYRKSAKEQG